MKVLFFGKLGDALGREVEVESSSPASVAELRRQLARLYPHAAGDLMNPAIRACVDDTIVGEDFVPETGANVEFFPPLSGG
jgi:sulfur-carrier protein